MGAHGSIRPKRFAKFDIIEDNIYPEGLSLYEQQKMQNYTLARAKKIALLALRWRPKGIKYQNATLAHMQPSIGTFRISRATRKYVQWPYCTVLRALPNYVR